MFSSFPLLKLISGKMHWRHLDLETFYWGMPWIPLDFMHYVLQSFFDFYNFVWAFCCTFKIVPTNSSQNKKVFSWLGLVLDWSSKKWGSWINQGSIKSLDFLLLLFFVLFLWQLHNLRRSEVEDVVWTFGKGSDPGLCQMLLKKDIA